jgi:menaquinone-dependent protoporphyrinogen oxidase
MELLQKEIKKMKNKVLVTYATISGSTQEIAEKVVETLKETGLEVDLLVLSKVQSLDGYSVVVLGAPLYMFHWHKDALNFLTKYRNVLTTGFPVAIFAGGPFGAGDEKEWQEVRNELDKELAKYPWFHPVSIEIVGGKFDPTKLHFPYNLIPALKKVPANDLRDWSVIQAWSRQISQTFLPNAS